MCQIGDIIKIHSYKDRGTLLGRHSFIVIDDEGGVIEGASYDMICNVMSSFKNEEQKQRKLSYPGNFPLVFGDTDIENNNGKDGFVKADQLYYFNKDSIEYEVIGRLPAEMLDLLLTFIEESDFEIIDILDNL